MSTEEASASHSDDDVAKGSEKTERGYTAVVHVHGMGSQRRYEEVSRLVDSLDTLAHGRQETLGRLEKIRFRLEPSRSDLPREIGYVTLVRRVHHDGVSGSSRAFRFYEAYWANVTAEGVAARDVVLWLLRNAIAPISALNTPWRLRARLRRAFLLKAWSRLARQDERVVPGDLKRMLGAFDDFEGWDARRQFPKGSSEDFIEFVRQQSNEGEQRERMAALAARWQAAYIRSELRNLFLLGSVLLTLLLGGGAALFGVVAGLKWLAGTRSLHFQFLGDAGFLKPTWSNAAALLAAILSAIGVTTFLRDFLGDVQFWTTYEETSVKHRKRRDILDVCCETLLHVINDPGCERVVVVSHSLGTTIAVDSLLELARRNRAANPQNPVAGPIPLTKIKHLITFGSPIDKVHYFFESYAGKYHRYNRVVEELRGDIGTPPFGRSGWPLIHWINFWDQADVVSAPLFSPANREFAHLAVDNVEIAGPWFPDPARAHSAYFEHPQVAEAIFRTVFDGEYAYPDLGHAPAAGPLATLLGPGAGRRSTRAFQAVAIGIPWLALASILFSLFRLTPLSAVAGELAAAAFVVAAAGWVSGRGARQKPASVR
jgi:hypothetical protein